MAVWAQDPAELNAQGVAHYEAGKWNDAIKDFERAYYQVPDNPTIRRNLCNAHQSAANDLAKVADFAAAVKHLEVSIGVDPQNAAPLIQLGSYYLRLNFVADAIFRLEDAITLDMKNIDAHYLLGYAYYLDNDIPSAREQWEWVAKVQPDRPGLKQNLEKATREGAVESDYRSTKSRHFQFMNSPDISNAAIRRVQAILDRAYIEIGRNFGKSYPPEPVPVIVYDKKGFSGATQVGEHVGALYDGKIRIPLVDENGNLLDDAEMKRRLYHEYTHVIVRFLAGENVPWWLNEGLAEMFSRDFDSSVLSQVQQANAEGKLFALASLEGSQLSKLGPDAMRLAYAQSHATVYHLINRYGYHRLVLLMSNLAEGHPIQEALRSVYNRTYESLQLEVARTLL